MDLRPYSTTWVKITGHPNRIFFLFLAIIFPAVETYYIGTSNRLKTGGDPRENTEFTSNIIALAI